MMTIRENVIKWLESCKNEATSATYDCAINEQKNDCLYTTTDGGMARLKFQEQENVNMQAEVIENPVKPNEIWHSGILMYYQCPACMFQLCTGDRYCPCCRRKVEWE